VLRGSYSRLLVAEGESRGHRRWEEVCHNRPLLRKVIISPLCGRMVMSLSKGEELDLRKQEGEKQGVVFLSCKTIFHPVHLCI
jgi:hypothetical protein